MYAFNRPGTYRATISRVWHRKAQTGSYQTVILYRGLDPLTNEWCEIAQALTWTKSAIRKMVQPFLSSLGWDPAAHGYDFYALSGDQSPLLGKICDITVGTSDFFEDDRLVVKTSYPAQDITREDFNAAIRCELGQTPPPPPPSWGA